VLTAHLPRVDATGTSAGAQTASLLSALLKDTTVDMTTASTAVRLSADDQFITCSLLATADWCADTTGQLHAKLKEKYTLPESLARMDMSTEQEHFYNVTSAALHILTQDLQAVCDAALTTMTKIRWVDNY
jgi:hypothetical protein